MTVLVKLVPRKTSRDKNATYPRGDTRQVAELFGLCIRIGSEPNRNRVLSRECGDITRITPSAANSSTSSERTPLRIDRRGSLVTWFLLTSNEPGLPHDGQLARCN